MGIFTRLRDILGSNINAMLEKAEDPEKLIKLMIQEMEDTLVEIKANCAASMATRARIARQKTEAEERAADWAGKAELAIRKGREDLAREALHERRRTEAGAEAHGRELEEMDAVVRQYQDDIRQIEEKLRTAREKHRVLVQRHIHARDSKRAQTQARRAGSQDAVRRFDSFENRIERMEAEAELVNWGRQDLREAFDDLERDEEIESELAALRERVSAPGVKTDAAADGNADADAAPRPASE
jgi:phage shock protein A